MSQTATQQAPADTDPAKAKIGWPKTPDGTIDWETVFEAPDDGLIAQLVDVDSHDLLFKVTETIIRQLFTRKGDESEVEAFLGELTRITGAADGDAAAIGPTRDSIIDLLRRIKNGRIEKAAAYVAEQKQKAAQGQKRRRIRRRDDDRKLDMKLRVMLMGGGGLAAALILAGVLFVLGGGIDGGKGSGEQVAGTPAADPATQQASERIAIEDAASDGTFDEKKLPGETSKPETPETAATARLEFTANGYPIGTLGSKDLPALGEHVMTLPPILFARNVGGGRASQTFILPVLSIRDPDSWSDICKWAPSLTEAINGIMSRQIPATGSVSPSEFRGVGEIAMQLINQRLGGVLVDDMFLLYDVENNLIDAGARCRAVKYG